MNYEGPPTQFTPPSARAPSCPIPIQIRDRKYRLHPAYGVNLANLQLVAKQTQNAQKPHTTVVKLALLNVRSLLKKSFLIDNLICSNNLDILLLTETWLDLANKCVDPY